MTKETIRLYRKFRSIGIGGIVGQDAMNCLRAARIVDEFENGEYSEYVRIEAKPETDNYFDVYGKECISAKEDKRIQEQIENLGVWCISAEYRLDTDSDKWEMTDSIGMCIYENPVSPFENEYVIDLMDSALKAVKNEMETRKEIKTPNAIGQIIRLNAGNDVNGNPRRVFVRLINGCIDQSWKEYNGRDFPESLASEYQGETVDTSAKEYRRIVKDFRFPV